MKTKLTTKNRELGFKIRVVHTGFKDYSVMCGLDFESFDCSFDNLSQATAYACKLSNANRDYFVN